MSKILSNILDDDLEEEFEAILETDENTADIAEEDIQPIEIVDNSENEQIDKSINKALLNNSEIVNTKLASKDDFINKDLGLNVEYIINDFVYVRNEIVDMTRQGKALLSKILEDAEDEGLLRAGVLQAYSELNTSLAQNLKLLMSMYDKIFKYSTQTQKNNNLLKNEGNIQNNNNCDVNNVFALNSAELLKLLKGGKVEN